MLTLGLISGLATWTLGVVIDRTMVYESAREQSRIFVPSIAGALKEGKLREAIKIANRYKRSHLARVAKAGLEEVAEQPLDKNQRDYLEASRQALDRAERIVGADLAHGLPALATIAVVAPLIGLIGMLVTIRFNLKLLSIHGTLTDSTWILQAFTASLTPLIAGLVTGCVAYVFLQGFADSNSSFSTEMRNISSELSVYLTTRVSNVVPNR